jgi:hypothetical protein
MGSMIHLAVGRLEIDWGKNSGFADHGPLSNQPIRHRSRTTTSKTAGGLTFDSSGQERYELFAEKAPDPGLGLPEIARAPSSPQRFPNSRRRNAFTGVGPATASARRPASSAPRFLRTTAVFGCSGPRLFSQIASARR